MLWREKCSCASCRPSVARNSASFFAQLSLYVPHQHHADRCRSRTYDAWRHSVLPLPPGCWLRALRSTGPDVGNRPQATHRCSPSAALAISSSSPTPAAPSVSLPSGVDSRSPTWARPFDPRSPCLPMASHPARYHVLPPPKCLPTIHNLSRSTLTSSSKTTSNRSQRDLNRLGRSALANSCRRWPGCSKKKCWRRGELR